MAEPFKNWIDGGLVRVAASLIAGAVSRRRAWRHIDSRRRFDELALRISTRFVSLPGEDYGFAAFLGERVERRAAAERD